MSDVPIFGWDRRQGASSVAAVLVVLSVATVDLAAGAPSGVSGGVVGSPWSPRCCTRSGTRWPMGFPTAWSDSL